MSESMQSQEIRLRCRVVPPTRSLPDLEEDVINGLLQPPRSLPPKYFYDERGSHLFDAICDTDEYYVTRTEEALLLQHAAAIIAEVQPAHIIEFGSGTSRKTRHLIDQCVRAGQEAAYWPFDVCEAMLRHSGRHLLNEYDWLQVNALVGDYLAGLHHLPRPDGACLYLFLGGTIGNFQPDEALIFLREVRAGMGPDDRLLLGADRIKAPQVLHAAYNDSEGLTADFNLNLLNVLNRELGAGFEMSGFGHRACYNEASTQIEMYLVAQRDQRVPLGRVGGVIALEAGEAIQTEISRKFSPASLQALLNTAGFSEAAHFEPANGYFSLVLAAPRE